MAIDWASAIHGAIGVTTGVVNSIVGGVQARKARDIDNQNLQLQKDAFSWQKEQHELMMQREDTAVQRRVADLEAAGLHPGLAAGSAAASHQAPAPSTPQRANRELEVASMVQGIMQQKATVGRTLAEMQLLSAQRERIKQQNMLDSERILHSERDRARLEATVNTMQHNLDIARSRGFMTTESSEMIRRYEYVIDLLKNILNREGRLDNAGIALPQIEGNSLRDLLPTRNLFGHDSRPMDNSWNRRYDENYVRSGRGSSRSKF